MVSNAARIPLFQDPGTEFRYGIHATILGKLIEVWAERPFEEFLREEFLLRLDMNSTMFGQVGLIKIDWPSFIAQPMANSLRIKLKVFLTRFDHD